MNDVKKVARVICEHKGINPFYLEPGDAFGIDGTCPNGDPGHYMWREFTPLARKILKVLGREPDGK